MKYVVATGLLLAVICSTLSADYSATVLSQNPIAFWRLNETTGDVANNLGTAGGDYSGDIMGGVQGEAGPNVLANGTALNGMGANNFALGMEAVDQYVTVVDSPIENRAKFTMTGWVKPSQPQANRTALFGQNDSIEFGIDPATQIFLWMSNTGGVAYTPPEIVDDAWYHVGIVGTGLDVRLYVNGQQVAVGGGALPGAAGYGASAYTFNIGGGGIFDPITANDGNQFYGAIDEVAMWDVALTDTQVQSMWTEANKASGNFSQAVLATNPLGYWPLNETTGTVADNAGTGGDALNGTYYGGGQGVDGPNLPGMGAGNKAYQAGDAVPTYVGVDARPLSNRTAFSIAGWAKYDDLPEAGRIGLFGQNDVIEFGYISPTTVQLWADGLPGQKNMDHAHDIAADEWVYLVATGDGEELVLYVNGEEVERVVSPLATEPGTYGSDNDFPFNIGAGVWDPTGNQFYGSMANVGVWDTALTALQIKAQFDAAVGSAGIVGDYNNNGALDAPDLDLQADAITGGLNPPKFDLNSDNLVNSADRVKWLHDLKKTWVGDSDLNGLFNSADFVIAFQAGKYETTTKAGWAEGDWDGNTLFQSGDFVAAFADGGYEAGVRPGAVSAVPEPGSIVLALLGLTGLWGFARRRQD